MSILTNLRNWRPTPNPILVKELRSRFRGWRAFLTLTGILSLMGLMLFLFYSVMVQQLAYSTTPISVQIGQVLFAVLAGMLLMVISAITPAVTAGAISSEMEKQTYEMLLTTPLHPVRILWGKLLSAMMFVFLLLFASIPMFSLVFTFGGVSIREMLKALAVLLVIAVFIGVLGLFYSTILQRSGRATVLAYLTLAGMMFGPYFVYGLSAILTNAEPPRILLMPTPITALFSAMAPSLSSDGPASLFWMLGLGFNSTFFGGAGISLDSIPRPVYHYSLPFFGFLSLVLYLITAQYVRPTRRLRPGRRGVILGGLLIAGYLLAVIGFFWITSNRYENIDFGFNRFPTPDPAVFGIAPAVEVVVPAFEGGGGGADVFVETPTPFAEAEAYPGPSPTPTPFDPPPGP